MNILSDVFAALDQLLRDLLASVGATDLVINLAISALVAFVIVNYLLTLALLIIWVERKVAGRMQDRIGPNRVGPYGLLQNVADVMKLMTKEIIIPDGADLIPYLLSPPLAVASVFMIWAVLPFSKSGLPADVNIGALYIMAVSSLGVMAVLLAGWSSNNKYALLGGFRAVAMLVSYEVPLMLTLLVPVMLTGSMKISEIIAAQPIYYIVAMPLAGLIFYIANVAEVGRSPFDLLEAESEIVAGFHIEYSGMAFAMFYLAEFLHAFTIAAIFATLFLGGWRGPGAEQFPNLGILYFVIKTSAVYFFNIWTRMTLPRVRIDHAMSFCWKFLVPLSLVLLVLMALVDKLGLFLFNDYLGYLTASTWLEAFPLALPRTLLLLVVNIFVGYLTYLYIRQLSRKEQERLESLNRPAVIESAHQAH